jgi:hypothetical protein
MNNINLLILANKANKIVGKLKSFFIKHIKVIFNAAILLT